MGTTPDHYAILGIDREADDKQIRSAYRRCALTAHPDKGGSSQAFHAVSLAFSILSNCKDRARYDATPTSGIAAGLAPAKRRSKNLDEIRDSALQHLEMVLKNLSRETRRKFLENTPKRVSEALMKWMQARCTKESTRATASASEPCSEVIHSCSLEPSQHRQSIPTVLPGGGDTPQRDVVTCQGVHRASGKSKSRSAQLYRASMCILNLMFLTRSVSFEKALDFHALLLLVRQTLQQCWKADAEVGVEALASSIEKAVEAASERMLESKADLGLTYRPVLSAVALCGRQINGRATHDLTAAVIQRGRLLEAKEAGWPELRNEWIRMLAENRTWENAVAHVDAAMRAFAPRRAKIAARQAQCQMKKQRQQVSEVFGPELTPEEHQQKEVSAAVKAVEKSLDAQSCDVDVCIKRPRRAPKKTR